MQTSPNAEATAGWLTFALIFGPEGGSKRKQKGGGSWGQSPDCSAFDTPGELIAPRTQAPPRPGVRVGGDCFPISGRAPSGTHWSTQCTN